MTFARAAAFLKRDLLIELSYRLALVTRIVGVFFAVASFYFVSRLLDDGAAPLLAPYGGDYFAFVLVGIALVGFQNTGLSSFSSMVSSAQAQGTLEAMLVTPTKLSHIVLFSSAWSFLFTSFTVLVYLAFGAFVFGADLAHANVASALLVLTLTTLLFTGVGVLSGSTILVLKRGDPVSWLFGSLSTFFAGTYFPISVLPAWVQTMAHAFPVFYALRAMRKAVLIGASPSAIAADLLVLGGLVAVVLPTSLVAFRRAVQIAKTDGSLATY